MSLSVANKYDITQYKECLDSCVIKRPSSKNVLQNICLNKAYDSKDVREYLKRKYIVHIPERNNRKQINRKKKNPFRKKARSWVAERTGAWHNKFRRLKVRYEVKEENYFSFLMLAGPRPSFVLENYRFWDVRLILTTQNFLIKI